MSKVSFKKFVEFVESDDEFTDEQINEIFGLFRNNTKLDKLKKEREKLKGMSAQKKAELDKALQDFKDGKRKDGKPTTDTAIDDATLDDVLSSHDRKHLAKMDKYNDRMRGDNHGGGSKNQTGRNFYESAAKTYYVHVDDNGRPTGPKARYEGTDKYGYASLKAAIKSCPAGASVEERFNSGSNDWAGRMMGEKNKNGDWTSYVKEDRTGRNFYESSASKYFTVTLDDVTSMDIAWERVMDDIRHADEVDDNDVYRFCKRAARELDLSEHDFNELRGAVEQYLEKHVKESKGPTVKAFKIQIPQGLTDSAIWDFIEDQSIVTIEDFTREGTTVYLYPHFERDFDAGSARDMQDAFDTYLRDNHLD